MKGSLARAEKGAAKPSSSANGRASAPRAEAAAPDVGNLAIQNLFRAGAIQTKLTIGSPDDPLEREADHVADRVMRSAEVPSIQRKCEACAAGAPCPQCEAEDKLHGKAAAGKTPRASATAESSIASLRGGGQPLPRSLRAFFEPRMGADFSGVRIHTGGRAQESARVIQARAFTAGRDVVFGAGEYAPDSPDGRRLLAHELVHVTQQGAVPGNRCSTLQRQPDPNQPQPSPAPTPTPSNPLTGPENAVQPAGAALDPAGKLTPPPDPKGELVVHKQTSTTFTDNQEYVRYQLEHFAADQGITRLEVFEDNEYHSVVGLDPPEFEAYRMRVVELVHKEVKSIRFWVQDYCAEFQRRAVDTVFATLYKSKAEVERQQERYGITSTAKTFLGVRYGTSYTMEQNKDTTDLVAAAAALQAKQKTVMSAWSELQSIPADPALTVPLPPDALMPPKMALKRQEDAVRVKLDTAEKAYNNLRHEQEGLHPILATYRLEAFSPDTGAILAKLASGSSESRAADLGSEITKKLENIESTRKDVKEDKELIWKLPFIVEATEQLPDVKAYKYIGAGLAKKAIIEKVAATKADEATLTLVLSVLGIGLALLAAVPTGGLSVAAAGGVAAAGVGADVLGVALAIRGMQKYEFESAASGTSFDKAKAISQDEPSLFRLALDILGAVSGTKGALEAFERLAQIRRLAIAAKTAGRLEEAAALLEKIEQEGNAVKAGAGIGTRLRTETESIASTVKRDVQEIQENLKNIRPSTMEGYVDEIPLAEGGFWRRKADGIWCRFASPPVCLIPPERIPVQVPTPTGGAAAEVARIEASGYQKLPNGFKALDAISGGKMEIITEDGNVITQYIRPTGKSIKYTSITGEGLRAKVLKDLNDLYQFSEYTLSNVRVKGLGTRQLDLIFEEGLVADLNKQTLKVLSDLKSEARDTMKITFDWYVTSGGRQIPGPKFFKEQAKMLKDL
jgi:Domain of unknown function (DUF4157)